MKTKFWLTLLCVLSFNQAEAKGQPAPNSQQNLQATRQHYAQLIAGTAPRLAELTMFTNMLPKGGDLHHHYSGAIYVETYLDWMDAQHYCVYRASDPEAKTEPFRVETQPQKLSEKARALCLSADAVRQDNAFYRELLKLWSDKDYDNHFHAQSAPDQQFFDTFGYFGALSGCAPNQGLKLLKVRALAENLGYLETMLKSSPAIDKPEFAALFSTLNAASSAAQIEAAYKLAFDFMAQDPDARAKLDSYLQSLEEAAAGIDDANFKLRFQGYVSRNTTLDKIFSGLYSAFAAAQRGKRVVGVNIVGPENGYVAMRDYSLHMQMFAFLKQRFPQVKLALHAGELTLGMVPPEGLRSHIHEAVWVAGANRIGHGVDIAHETDAPELLNEMRQRNVAIEVNLSSNAFILGIQNEAHPVLLYAHYHVPFVISTDDAGVSRNNLSGEYLLYASRYRPSYDDLKRVVYNSIRYSFLAEDEKREEISRLDRRFMEFEARVAKLPRH